MISAMLGKESVKIYFKASVILLFEAYGLQKHFVLYLSAEASVVNTAKVYEIERAAPHYKEGVNTIRTVRVSQIVYLAAVCGKAELAYAKQCIIVIHRVSE